MPKSTGREDFPLPSEVTIRLLEEKDHGALVSTLNPWNFSLKGTAYVRWLEASNPADHFSLIAMLDQEMIGYYGTITVPLKIGAQIVPCYRGGIFVHPAHRKKKYNVFNLLVRAAHAEIKKRSGVTYGFPTPAIIKYYSVKTKARIIKPIPEYTFFLGADGFFRNFLKHAGIARLLGRLLGPLWHCRFRWFNRKQDGISISRIYFFDPRFDALWEKASRDHRILSARHAGFLNWRYFKEPEELYAVFTAEKNNALQGYVILKSIPDKTPRTGMIADLFSVRDCSISKALIGQAIKYFEAEGMQKIRLFLSDSFYENMLKSAGFLRVQNNDWMMAKSYAPSIPDALFYDTKNWFVTTADTLFA